MRVARLYVVSGRVQGVGFRFFTESAAAREDLHGWVRNLPDGRVEVMAEGQADAIERFEILLWKGPRNARVDHVQSETTASSGQDTGFTIR